MLTEVDPCDLRFTQGSVSIKFKYPHEDTRIDDAVNKIVSGEWRPSIFPAIEVVKYSGHLWSLDNRRLWVFRKANVRSISANVKNSSKHPRFLNLLENPGFMRMTCSKTYFPRVRGKETLKPLRRLENVLQLSGVARQSTVKREDVLDVDDMPNCPPVDSTTRSDDHRRGVSLVDPDALEKVAEYFKSFVRSVCQSIQRLWDFLICVWESLKRL